MKYLNLAADFCAAPTTFRAGILRLALFFLLASLVLWASHHVDTPVSIGFGFGYLWGFLTTYGSIRKELGWSK